VNVALWIVQVLLALLFVWAGGMKLVLPLDQLTGPFPLPGWFIRFIGLAELLGGLGMILPGLLRRSTWLTPLAACGLVIIMMGATMISLRAGGVGMALIPVAVGVLAAFIAYGRGRPALLPGR
jgi:uncharacterized membrane protein YphA (DoxX/SURF4 family)